MAMQSQCCVANDAIYDIFIWMSVVSDIIRIGSIGTPLKTPGDLSIRGQLCIWLLAKIPVG